MIQIANARTRGARRRLLVAAPFEVAEDHRRAVALGEPVDLLVERAAQLLAHRGAADRPRCRRAPFVPPCCASTNWRSAASTDARTTGMASVIGKTLI